MINAINITLNLTPDLENKLKTAVNNYLSVNLYDEEFKPAIAEQFDLFFAARRNKTPDNINIIDDEAEILNDDLNHIEYEDPSQTDRSKNTIARILTKEATPVIAFAKHFNYITAIFDEIKNGPNITKKFEWCQFISYDAQDHDLGVVEIISLITLFKLVSDPVCLNNDLKYYIRENPIYANFDFKDPFNDSNIKKYTGIDINNL